MTFTSVTLDILLEEKNMKIDGGTEQGFSGISDDNRKPLPEEISH